MRKNLFSDADHFTVFKNEKALYPEFLPHDLPGREPQLREITVAIKPLLKGSRATNVLLYGGTGTGKTACAKFVARELEAFTSKVKTLYVNCFEYNSRFAVLSKIANAIGYPVPRRGGTPTDEVFDYLVQYLPKSDFKLLVILDELDQLLKTSEGSKILYDLLRLGEHDVSPIPFIGITNDITLTFNLDARVRSSLLEKQVEFKPYSPKEIKDILRERAKLSLIEDFYDDAAIGLATAFGAENGGDVRISLESLWKGAKIAEGKGEQLKADHVRKAFKARMDSKAVKALDVLTEKEKRFLREVLPFLEGKGSITTGELFELYSKSVKQPLADRTFRLYLSRLSTFNLLTLTKAKASGKGQTQLISLNVEPERLNALLEK